MSNKTYVPTKRTQPAVLRMYEYPARDRSVRLVAAKNIAEAANYAMRDAKTDEVRLLSSQRAWAIIASDRLVSLAVPKADGHPDDGAEPGDFGVA